MRARKRFAQPVQRNGLPTAWAFHHWNLFVLTLPDVCDRRSGSGRTQDPASCAVRDHTGDARSGAEVDQAIRAEVRGFLVPEPRPRLAYRRLSDHSSFCSSIMAPTSRVIEASLGKMPTTFRHEGQDVVLPVVHEGAELGELSRSWSATDLQCARAASAESCTNTVPMAAETMRRCVLRPWTCNQASA